ncbi:MAG: ABC transporter permease [Bacteroidales bacterium]
MQIEENFRVAANGLLEHKVRSLLTMLGIIFGVAAVISMLSIGEGAKREAIAKYKDLGVNNIIIRDKDFDEKQLEEIRAKFSPGLTIAQAYAIKEVIPSVEDVAPQTETEVDAKYYDKSSKATVVGITPSFLSILNYSAQKGVFINQDHYDRSLKVCVLGASVAKQLFPFEEPTGKSIKIDDQWMEVIGIMANKSLFTETVGELASRDLNNDIYIPLSTFNKRLTKGNELESEIKQITVKVKNSEELIDVSSIIKNLLNRHHFNNDDFNIIIPYELLKQEEKERRIYNVLLGAIAAISLLVGGIGIMNIMLATVMERTREIGVRRAIGGTKKDILSQFLTEAIAISITGGIIGVLLGLGLSLGITLITDVKTHVALYSVIIAFFFSVLVGIIFGFLPAKKAAGLNPIESIRYE